MRSRRFLDGAKDWTRHRNLVAVLLALAVLAATTPARAQPGTATLRLALVSQWVVNQHRIGSGFAGQRPLAPELRATLDGGVVDRVVFWWQRGVIQRRALVSKPIRVVSGDEAATLGGRGDFQLLRVRPPAGASAWTEVEVAPRTNQSADVLVLEIGGELNTISQVLETLLVIDPRGVAHELVLARRAVVGGEGVPVVGVPFGRPVTVNRSLRFGGTSGAEFLVARSPVEAAVSGDITTNGLADQSAVQTGTGEWREGDRVFVRVPLGTLRAGAPAVVLGWRDRTYRPDGGLNDQRRTQLPVPFVR